MITNTTLGPECTEGNGVSSWMMSRNSFAPRGSLKWGLVWLGQKYSALDQQKDTSYTTIIAIMSLPIILDTYIVTWRRIILEWTQEHKIFKFGLRKYFSLQNTTCLYPVNSWCKTYSYDLGTAYFSMKVITYYIMDDNFMVRAYASDCW